jgi:hypothetical protein
MHERNHHRGTGWDRGAAFPGPSDPDTTNFAAVPIGRAAQAAGDPLVIYRLDRPVAPGNRIPAALAAILGIAVCRRGRCDQYVCDRDIDAVIRRTARPIPAGRIAPWEALGFITLAAFAVALMALAINLVAAAVLALSILFYHLRLHHVAAPHGGTSSSAAATAHSRQSSAGPR